MNLGLWFWWVGYRFADGWMRLVVWWVIGLALWLVGR